MIKSSTYYKDNSKIKSLGFQITKSSACYFAGNAKQDPKIYKKYPATNAGFFTIRLNIKNAFKKIFIFSLLASSAMSTPMNKRLAPQFSLEESYQNGLRPNSGLFNKALLSGNTERVKSYLNNGYNPNYPDENGVTPLMIAAQSFKKKFAKTLINHGADVNQSDNIGNTALLIATYKNNIEIAKVLLEKQARVNQANSQGLTPLMLAAKNGNLKFVLLLLKHGADIRFEDALGQDAAQYALHNGQPEIFRLLHEKMQQDEHCYPPPLTKEHPDVEIDVSKELKNALLKTTNFAKADTFKHNDAFQYTLENNKQEIADIIASRSKKSENTMEHLQSTSDHQSFRKHPNKFQSEYKNSEFDLQAPGPDVSEFRQSANRFRDVIWQNLKQGIDAIPEIFEV